MGGFDHMAKQILAGMGINPDELKTQLTTFFEGVRNSINHFDGRLTGLESEVRELRESIDALISMQIHEGNDNAGRTEQPEPCEPGSDGEGGGGSGRSGGKGDGSGDARTDADAGNAGTGNQAVEPGDATEPREHVGASGA